ncbi:MAG: hypothetical protein PHF86_11210 [Candidatus Nanoarchaeia archaeon]|nr:hypothetical protein [Candidatus Nanoarchaeia archaeon]
MSRSYKKYSLIKKNNSFEKRYANRVVRRKKLLFGNGGHYKKAYDSYRICDWKFSYRRAKSIASNFNYDCNYLDFIRK